MIRKIVITKELRLNLAEGRIWPDFPRRLVPGIPRPSSDHLSELARFVSTKQATSHFGVRCMTSPQIPVSIQRKTCNILETLSNLLYLAEMEADDPQKVRTYVSLSKERLEAMTQLLLVGKEDGGNQQQSSFGGDSLRS
jgi:hypothetical protein